MHGSHAGGRRNQLSKALGLRLGARKGNLKTLGDGLMRQLAGVCGWIRDCFKPDFDSSAIPAAGEPVDHEFRWTGTRWTPMSQSQWGIWHHCMAPPVSGRWVSAPIVTCPEPSAAGRSHSVSVWEPLEDEPAAHCWLVCGQSIFQVDPGNPNPVLLAEREEVRTLFSHENGGVADAVLPGFQAMPTVGFEIKRTSVGVVVELAFGPN